MKKKATITIEFDNKKAAIGFAEWLCGSGEQDYWNYQECREEDEPKGNITATIFHYHGPEDETKAQNDLKRYGKFMCDNIIRTTCGRLDKEYLDESDLGLPEDEH
jgi:hypothetical protein